MTDLLALKLFKLTQLRRSGWKCLESCQSLWPSSVVTRFWTESLLPRRVQDRRKLSFSEKRSLLSRPSIRGYPAFALVLKLLPSPHLF